MTTGCVVAAVLLALCCMSADGFFFGNVCSPNPCPLNGNCRPSKYSKGYTCSCPPKVTPCNNEVMNLFKKFNYNRNGQSEWTVSILNPIDAVRFKSIYTTTVKDVAKLNLPDEVMNLFKKFNYNRNGQSEWTVSILNPIDAVRFKSIYTTTVKDVAKLNLPGAHNGEWDAVRHALTNYRWTKAVNAGEAKKFADAHERSNPNPFRELAMDLHNNNMGRQLAQDPANSKRKDVDVILKALKTGKLQRKPKSSHPSVVDRPSR